MNILVLTHSANLRSTTCVIDALISETVNSNINISVVCSNKGPWISSLVDKGINCFHHSFDVPSFSKPISFIRDAIYWIQLIKKMKIDLIHINEHEVYPTIRYVAFLLKIPVVVGIRFVIGNGFAKWLFGGICHPKKLLFTSKDQYQRSIHNFPDYVDSNCAVILGNGRDYNKLVDQTEQCDVGAFKEKLGLNGEQIVLGTASSIRPRKRIEDFVKLIQKLRDSGKDVYGLIAGGPPYADEDYFKKITTLIHSLGLEKNIKMLGNLDDLSSFYACIDIFISTSELETFGMSVSEAMALGKPALGYTGGSVQEVIGNPFCTVEVGNLQGLYEKCTQVLESKELWQGLSIEAKSRIFSNYTPEVLAARLKEHYDLACSRKRK
ncbi:MAG: glycosyltransferase involved in cell wall biosynthesis [Paraglaciecola sp.]|jgi:glycosyltransferase involved in cell wall biosynthesis